MTSIGSKKLRQAVYVAISVAFASLVFFVFGAALGDAAAIVSVVPVGLVAAFHGVRPGLVATTLAFPFNTFVLDYLAGVRNEDGAVTQGRALITLSLVVISWVFGRYFVLTKKLERYEREEERDLSALALSEERLRQFLSATPDPIFRIGKAGRLLEIHGHQHLGIERAKTDYLFRHLSELLPNHLANELIEGAKRAVETGEVQLMRGSIDLSDGPHIFEVNLSAAGDEAVGIARDITVQVKAEEQENYIDLVRTKDEFVASVAHELRTPLSGVSGFADALRDGHIPPDEYPEIFETISSQARLLMFRIEDLIVAARADVGRIQLDVERFDMASMARRVVESIRAKDVLVVGEGAFAVGDTRRVAHAVRNLISNAITHGGDSVFVTVEAEGGRVVTTISDDGPGLSTENPEAPFVAYKTSEEAERKADRLGLGLVVARQLARLMDGDVTYQRSNGMSSFVLTLPSAS